MVAAGTGRTRFSTVVPARGSPDVAALTGLPSLASNRLRPTMPRANPTVLIVTMLAMAGPDT